MKKIILLFILATMQLTCLQAQSLSDLQDSCYYYLERHDTTSFLNSYLKIAEAFEQENDFEMYTLKKDLCAMGNKDQSIRILLMDAQKRYGKDDAHTQGIRCIMNEIDSVNALRVTRIIDKYGWLSPDDIGEEANDALFFCIQHCNQALIQTKYLPILKQAVAEGAAKGWQYAFLTDRCLMNQGQPQVYGTQTIKAANQRTYVVPLQDAERVDELRKEIGLEPLSRYMEYFGEEWTKETYLKELPQCKAAFENWYTRKK